MSSTILTPFDFSEPVKAGRRRFWKQVLPLTSIDYEGQKVDFDEPFHKDLELSFKEGAYDQVPLVFADSGNRHNMDPRNFAGDVLQVENRGKDGTWALIEADRAAARTIARNPKLGVSARIVQGIKKADGRTFNRAINHVLLTMNPRIGGMSPWKTVDLSGTTETEEVVDLTATEYTEGNAMGKPTTAKSRRRQIDLSALDDEQFATLLDLATEAGVLDDEEVDEDEDEGADLGEVEDPKAKKPTKKKSTTKVKVEKEVEGGDPDEDEEEDEEEDDESTDLSDPVKSETNATVRSMQIDLAEERWNNDREKFIDAGVPPFLLDLAGPILASPDTMVIDLAEGETVNATDTIRKMLDGVKGMIDLTPDIGHMIDLTDEQTDEDKKFLDAWDKQYG